MTSGTIAALEFVDAVLDADEPAGRDGPRVQVETFSRAEGSVVPDLRVVGRGDGCGCEEGHEGDGGRDAGVPACFVGNQLGFTDPGSGGFGDNGFSPNW